MTAAFLLNAVIIASLVTLGAWATTPLLRNWSARGAYAFATIAFFAAALVPLAATMAPRARTPVATSPEIVIREDLSFVTMAWLAGLLLLLAREGIAQWHLARRRGRPLSDEERLHLGVPQGVVVEAVGGTAPMTVGALRPRILLPPDMLASTVVTRAVLAHESSHVRWRDPLVNGAVRATLVFLWPVFPLWALERLVRREREAAADAAAVADLDGDEVCLYTETMLAWARRGSPAGALGIAESDLEHRVSRLFRHERFSALSIAISVAALALAATASALAPAVRYRPQIVSLTVNRATVASGRSLPLPERRLDAAQRSRAKAAQQRDSVLPFGRSFTDVYFPADPATTVHRHVTEAVAVAVHEHRADPPREGISETIVIRDVRRQVIRVRN